MKIIKNNLKTHQSLPPNDVCLSPYVHQSLLKVTRHPLVVD